jgi:YbbR domain-containing protein
MNVERMRTIRSLRLASVNFRRAFHTANLLRFVVALVLAFALWAWVTYENDPEVSRTIVSLPVQTLNLNPDLEIVGELPVVDLHLQGPQSVLQPMERDNVQAVVDLAAIEEPGAHEVEVEVSSPSGIRVRDVRPSSVVVQLDQISARDDLRVAVRGPDDIPPNYQLREVSVEPETVRVSGPAGIVNQVAEVVVDVSMAGRTGSFSDSYSTVPVDANGTEVNGVTVTPGAVSVSVEVDVRGQVRKVIPVIVGDDSLAPGFELVRTTVLPTDEIIIDGNEDDLANVFFLTTVPIDITDWDGSQILRDVDIDQSALPASIQLDTAAVHVSIEIRRQTHEREIEGVRINLMNAPPDYEVSLSQTTAIVVLEGSRTAIDGIDLSEITVFVNVANAEPGTYQLELRVIVPPQVQYREITPQFVEVVVSDPQADPTPDDGENDAG